jgi:3D (Asp-Asp-Asp) domain-containing protein
MRSTRLKGVISIAAVLAIGAGMIGGQPRPVDILIRTPEGVRQDKFWTWTRTVRGALEASNIRYSLRDVITPRLNASFNTRIQIRQTIPVLVNTAHQHLKVWTADYKVGTVLHHLAIKLTAKDVVKPSLSTVVKGRTTITIIQRWWEHKTSTVSLPFGVEHQANSSMAVGKSEVVRPGQTGLERLIKSVLMQDGKPVTERTQTQVVRQPVSEIIGYGTKKLVASASVATDVVRSIAMVATGYWPDPSWSTGITAMGTKAQFGVAAVDPSVIPLGTHLYVPGYGPAIAEDTGGAIIGDRIDLCFNDGYQAIDWGVRPVTVEILAPSTS